MFNFKEFSIVYVLFFTSTLLISQGSDTPQIVKQNLSMKNHVKRDIWESKASSKEGKHIVYFYKPVYMSHNSDLIESICFSCKNDRLNLSTRQQGRPPELGFLRTPPYSDYIKYVGKMSNCFTLTDKKRVSEYLAAFYDRALINDHVVDTIKIYMTAFGFPFNDFRNIVVKRKVKRERTKKRIAVS